MHDVRLVVAHDQRVAERAEIGLEIGYRLSVAASVRLYVRWPCSPACSGLGIEFDARGDAVQRLLENRVGLDLHLI